MCQRRELPKSHIDWRARCARCLPSICRDLGFSMCCGWRGRCYLNHIDRKRLPALQDASTIYDAIMMLLFYIRQRALFFLCACVCVCLFSHSVCCCIHRIANERGKHPHSIVNNCSSIISSVMLAGQSIKGNERRNAHNNKIK